jgi:DNA-binding NarL/FixJ family response regulator
MNVKSGQDKLHCAPRSLPPKLYLFAATNSGVQARDMIRLFIVDQNSKVRHALEARLSSSSRIEVIGTARDPTEGVSRNLQTKPDIILLDAKTAGPPEDVAKAVGDLASQGSSVIVLTSYAFEAEREAALDSGAAQYLLKDIDSTALIREIESLNKPNVQQAKG